MANVAYGTAVIAAARMFLDTIVKYPYLKSRFAVLAAKNDNVSYSEYGLETAVREVTAGNAADHDEASGFLGGGLNGTSAWTLFTAQFDREKTFVVGFLQEMNSILAGMTPTIVALIDAFWDKFGAEIDACAATTIYNSIPNANKFTTSTYDVDAANALKSIYTLSRKSWAAGVGDMKKFAFVDDVTFSAIGENLITDYGKANAGIIRINPMVSQDVADRVGVEGLGIDINVLKLNGDVNIICVPASRMYTKIVMLDGRSTGQEAGGYAPATTVPGYALLKVLMVPEAAAVLSIRHIISKMTVPSSAYAAKVNAKRGEINTDYFGQATIEEIGVDQIGDQWKVMNRVKHGVIAFDTWLHTIFAITSVPVALNPDPVGLSILGGVSVVPIAGQSITVIVTGTQLVDGMKVSGLVSSTPLTGDGVALTTGTETVQTATIVIPANATAADIVYDIKVSILGTDYEATPTTPVTSLHDPANE